ncbi:hypothetical protein [Sphingomonas sp. CFBP 13720]|uniref:hypothetical protein n=1 Tax=Sphingomonas sp. CFBP 13720 TaxID=2775302 RepID=UPI00177D6321|nr:hypothetical protein [Sphingomonas sp. CFBP 13720]MBD8677311.1 hypothetical protein [Sphingomonas sp. CFBP 13720]
MTYPAPCLSDPADIILANDLIAGLGGIPALEEAAGRAEYARDLGNAVCFRQWRRVARLVSMMARPGVRGTIH